VAKEDRLICSQCVYRLGKLVGRLLITNLCDKCRAPGDSGDSEDENDSEYIIEKEGKKYLVDQTNVLQPKTYEIRECEEAQVATFNPLEDLALSLGRKKEMQDVDAGSIEFQFVDHFFQKTAQGGQVTRVQKLVNKPI
jgi:hypothetical protein